MLTHVTNIQLTGLRANLYPIAYCFPTDSIQEARLPLSICCFFAILKEYKKTIDI